MDRGQAHSLVTGRQNCDGSHKRNILSKSQPRKHTWECAGSSPRSVTSEIPGPGRKGARGCRRSRPGQAAVGHRDWLEKGLCALKLMVSPALLPGGKVKSHGPLLEQEEEDHIERPGTSQQCPPELFASPNLHHLTRKEE